MPNDLQRANDAMVWLVGSGPGGVDDLTIRAARLIEQADVILHDALVTDDILALAGKETRMIPVGKRGHRGAVPQDFTNHLMVSLAKTGQRVVRLKGGDPSVYGRAQEEREFLEEHGVDVRVAPGVTTASAAAAQFGFSLTERETARRVMFATGRTLNGPQTEWRMAADKQTTLCLYMACADISDISKLLIDAGRDASTPALITWNVGRQDSGAVQTCLKDLPSKTSHVAKGAPVFIVIGEATAQAKTQNLAPAVQPALKDNKQLGAPGK